ncbi:MAG: hypothetical protein HOV80_13660 [Polyangiaceae bacterium]|nr:hypothetical protein [Polyangiaceae bacterium]
MSIRPVLLSSFIALTACGSSSRGELPSEASAVTTPAAVVSAAPTQTAEASVALESAAPVVPPVASPTTSASASPLVADADGYFLLYDFGPKDAWRTKTLDVQETEALVARFPHPHAKSGTTCGVNFPQTPRDARREGRLLANVTFVRGAFTRAGADQAAYLIDYCATGDRQPRTRRLLVLEGDKTEIDHELGQAELGEEALHAIDVTNDGIAELLLTTNKYRPGTSQLIIASLLQGAPGKPRIIAKWDAIDHCSVLKDPKVQTTRRISFRVNGSTPVFRDTATTEKCFSPPAPP